MSFQWLSSSIDMWVLVSLVRFSRFLAVQTSNVCVIVYTLCLVFIFSLLAAPYSNFPKFSNFHLYEHSLAFRLLSWCFYFCTKWTISGHIMNIELVKITLRHVSIHYGSHYLLNVCDMSPSTIWHGIPHYHESNTREIEVHCHLTELSDCFRYLLYISFKWSWTDKVMKNFPENGKRFFCYFRWE